MAERKERNSMVGVKKIITNCNDTIIQRLHNLGYDHVELFYHPNPRHKAEGLVESQVLVIAWKYKPRIDRQNKKVGNK